MMRRHRGLTIGTGIGIIAVLALLSSCLGLQVETRFNEDGSGQMSMTMRVSKAVLEMGEEGGDTGLDIPLSKEEIEAEFSDVDGVRLVEVNEEETDEDLIITSLIEFDSLDAMLETEDSPVQTATLTRDGDRTIFTMTVGEAQDLAAAAEEDSPFGGAEMDDAMLAMIEAFLEGYFMEYRVTAPKPIISHSHGELDESGRTVTIRMPMAEYFTLEEPYDLVVEW